MSKKLRLIISLIIMVCVVVSCLTACDPPEPPFVEVDYGTAVTLDMSSDSLKQKASVYQYVDGDTAHFTVPTSMDPSGTVKARFLAVDTPEVSGSVEPYGKAASTFTKTQLSKAKSIYIESDNDEWNIDSTGTRYLLWIWYMPEGSDVYRNLNLELLQQGLAKASNSAGNRYGETCMSAIAQGKTLKLNIHSGQQDPNFYYGDAKPVTLRELRTNIEEYTDKKVAFEGTVTLNSGSNGVYVEDVDADTGLTFGMYVYYGFGLSSHGTEILSIGNRVLVVGVVTYYATGGSYQVSDVKYRAMKPDDPNNLQLISSDNEAQYNNISGETFNSDVEVENDGTMETFKYSELALSSTVAMDELTVKSVYVTQDGPSMGAMTLTCQSSDGHEVKIRTEVFRDEDGGLLDKSEYQGKTIDVKGIVEIFNDTYQIKVLLKDYITVK